MKERKYKEDWINETRFDERGKETRVPVYRGSLFSLPPDQNRRKLLLYALLPWVGYVTLVILYFRLDFPAARVMYVFLPAALGLFPCLYWALGVWALLRAPEKMTRLQKENGVGRVLRSAAGCLICSAATLIGETVFLLSGGSASREWPGIIMLLSAAVLALGTVRAFRSMNRLLSEERRDPS